MRIVFVLCEGPHDVAFLSRLLSSAGYIHYKKKVSDFPFPLGQWLINSTKKLSVQDLNVDKVYKELSAVLPGAAMVNDERGHLVLLYSMNGESRKEERKILIKRLKEWGTLPENEKEFSISEESSGAGISYGLIILYDADKKGIKARIKEIREEIGTEFSFAAGIENNGDIVTDGMTVKIGAYVFADSTAQEGTLENILFPIMRSGNEAIFQDAEDFLLRHKRDERLRPLVFKKSDSGEIVEERGKTKKYHHIKSILGVAGQLQNSGTSNTVCIEKTDYITLEKIKNSATCQEILEMFARL